eukprot:TRINITY_DN30885_c0_g1_i2.p2 TRINITY_DN30885_c0_g1~~TRINITY_DN30885_c0_g1_i2.p2  ORF type:complete len:620 (+),score=272.47 TRINITY_DN30885_c0_g1_i2:315-2174(+)
MAGDLTPEQIQQISEECLADPAFIKRFKDAVGDSAIPDPAQDPVGHAEFIQRLQASLAEDTVKHTEGEIFEDAEGTWTYTLPIGVFCIKATDLSGKKKIFINICKSPSIAEPMPMTAAEADESGMQNKDLQFRVPISIGPPRIDKDKAGSPSMVYDIAVNPMTLEKCDADYEFKRLVCAMCLYGLKEKHEPELNSDQYKQPNLKCKGKPAVQRVRVTRSANKNAFNNEINLQASGKPSGAGGDIKLSEDASIKTPLDNHPAPQPQKKLIEVLGEETTALKPGEGIEAFYNSTRMQDEGPEEPAETATPVADIRSSSKPDRPISIKFEGKYDWSHHKNPELNSYWKTRVDVPEKIIVSVHLPEVELSIRECNVDVSTTCVAIYAIDDEDLEAPYAKIDLRFPVDADNVAGAKFGKKKKNLTLTLAVQLPDEYAEQSHRREVTAKEDAEEKRAEREKVEAEEEERAEAVARAERLRKEEEEQQSFNKSLVEAAKAMQEGTVPPEMQKMVDEMPPPEAQTLLARLLDGQKRGDSADTLLEKLPESQINGLCNSLRDKLGLARPTTPAPTPASEEKPAGKKKAKDGEEEDEEDESQLGYGFDRMSKKLFDVQLKNRFLFALDL